MTAQNEPATAEEAEAKAEPGPAKDQSRSALYDLELQVSIVAGRKSVSVRDLASWGPDTLVALDLKADAPIELCVDGRVVATGELCEGAEGPDSFGIRILDVVESR